MMTVYLDHSATTQVSERVLNAMLPYFKEKYGNPSSLHTLGFDARKVLNQSKRDIAQLLNCHKNELYFTSCGTESTNWAIKGLAFEHPEKTEIITTTVEHHATLHATKFLEQRDYTVHKLDVDDEGFISLETLKNTINDNTLMVSIIYANNEIGTIQDIKAIASICKEKGVYLHVDAVQAVCHIPIDLQALDIDLMSISGHKFHAPKGIGVLYIKSGVEIENLIHGGQQEYKKRSGTENIPYIVGITQALKDGHQHLETYRDRLDALSHRFITHLDQANIDYRLNGPDIGLSRLPGHLNISIRNLDGADITYYLNKNNIYVSTGSACDSESILPSHVLRSIGVPENYIHASIRFSIGTDNTKEQIDYVAKTFIDIITKINGAS
jgi:cysteine desulfurase